MNRFLTRESGKKEEEIVREVLEDYNKRKEEKRAFEQAWLLNINFLIGNQFSYILPSGEIGEAGKSYAGESREVFNHIAPIVDSRLSKLSKVRPTMAVRPASNSTEDEEAAKLSEAVISAASVELGVPELIKHSTLWSEVTGTSFYKIIPSEVGNLPAVVDVVSPFEIFPFSPAIEKLEDNPSIIHAKSIAREDAEEIYGLSDLVGEDISSMSLDFSSGGSFCGGASNVMRLAENIKKDQVLVVERYFKASEKMPGGHLQVVVGSHLVYDGEIPFGDYPFVKQVSMETIGSFWGTSIIDRCIPVQRAYNGIKNRKIEYLARFSSGVLAVEEGSVDVEAIEDEGLMPGKVVVYRAGSAPPRFMEKFDFPNEFSYEEERLLNELITLTGVSELMRNSLLPSNVTSGRAINLLTEADNTRLAVPAENIRNAILALSKKIMAVFSENVREKHSFRVFGEHGRVQMFYWKGSDLSAFDIVLDTANELSDSVSERRALVMELFKAGLFADENGKLDARAKSKILEMVGFGTFDAVQDLTELHLSKAREENLHGETLVALEVDDHALHIAEHTKHIIEKGLDGEDRDKLIMHIRAHKAMAAAGASEKNLKI